MNCSKDKVLAAINEILSIISEWQDAEKVAESTSRVALSGPIANMQSAKRKLDNLEVPPCLDNAKIYSVKAMESTIDGFISFMGDEADSVVNGHFTDAADYLDQATKEMDRLQSCAPNCD